MAQLTMDMDQDGPEHPLQCKEAYFMDLIHNVLAIQLLHYSGLIQLCDANLGYPLWR